MIWCSGWKHLGKDFRGQPKKSEKNLVGKKQERALIGYRFLICFCSKKWNDLNGIGKCFGSDKCNWLDKGEDGVKYLYLYINSYKCIYLFSEE